MKSTGGGLFWKRDSGLEQTESALAAAPSQAGLDPSNPPPGTAADEGDTALGTLGHTESSMQALVTEEVDTIKIKTEAFPQARDTESILSETQVPLLCHLREHGPLCHPCSLSWCSEKRLRWNAYVDRRVTGG